MKFIKPVDNKLPDTITILIALKEIIPHLSAVVYRLQLMTAQS